MLVRSLIAFPCADMNDNHECLIKVERTKNGSRDSMVVLEKTSWAIDEFPVFILTHLDDVRGSSEELYGIRYRNSWFAVASSSTLGIKTALFSLFETCPSS